MHVAERCNAAPTGFRFKMERSSGMKLAMDRAAALPPVGDRAELAQLLQRVAANDRGSLKLLYERTSAKLYGICLRVVGDEADAQDVLQDVYVTVWRKAGQYDRAKASAITWLAVLARNKAIDLLRNRRAPSDDLQAAEEVPDASPSAFEVVEQADDAARLAHCLDALDERARTMIRQAFFEGTTYSTLADQAGVPLPTMKSVIRRGLLRLRECLDR